jgi:hypothetical protein
MTDSSDGLFKSIELLTENKGAVINMEKIPLSQNLIKYTNIYSFDTLPIILIYKRYKHCKLYKEIFTILVFTYFQLF